MKRFICSLLLTFVCLDAYATDTDIRVLSLLANNSSTSSALTHMAAMQVVYENSAIGSPGQVGINVIPIPIPIDIDIDNTNTQIGIINSAYGTDFWAPDIEALRAANQADIVIIYTESLPGACGMARGNKWNNFPHVFQPGPGGSTNGLDLFQKDSHYIGFVSTSNNCDQEYNNGEYTGAHEFGHLLGGNHQNEQGLLPSDKANVGHYTSPSNTFSINWRSPIGSVIVDDQNPSNNLGVEHCYEDGDPDKDYLCYPPLLNYSNVYPNDNKHTLDITALSVANWFQIGTPTGCSLSVPQNVSSIFLGCYNGVAVHSVSWEDACPAETELFPFLYSTDTNPYNPFSYSMFGLVEADGSSSYSQVVYQTQPFIHVKILACSGAGCTDWTDDTHVTLNNPCSNW